MPYLNINGTRLFFKAQGSGTDTLVFAHGLLFDSQMFENQVRVLKDRYRCIRFDFRGHGESDVTDDGYDMDTLTEDAAGIIRELECAPCHFIGFSMGGFVGLRLATYYPRLLKSLILVDTSADPEPRSNIPKYKLLNFISRWIGVGPVAGQVMPLLFSEEFLNDPSQKEQRKNWRQFLINNNRLGVTRAVDGVMKRKGVYEKLDEIDLPVLIIVGENDTATPPEKSHRMNKRLSRSSLVSIPGAGHMTPLENPVEVTKALQLFLDRFS